MGVPKFFRYISERYPCLSEFVKEYQIPVFDNLYLDMNGIIHMCSHPDDNNPHFRITEEKIFADIFHYIEVLFRMIKPQKVFFMAIDGVAPRAKMNQQRGRRFRSAKEAKKSEEEAVKKGEKLPDEERFDSNCITPGTVFMARLHEQLKYFIVNKISTDQMWRQCKVIFSGQETPGEGEHKIMDFIRYIRAQPGYDPNTRHCLYGLDADLIMLGLCTHDPHFSLLREEVKFGKKPKRSNVPEEIRFYLLHLSLMREYLELEFSSLKAALEGKFLFNIENIIDDWILMGFLVGNDFIPNLPNLHISHGSLPLLYEVYKEVLPTLDGYINEGGTLNLQRFEKFMKKLAEIDMKNFEEIYDDLTYMKSKTGRKVQYHTPVNSGNKRDTETDTTTTHYRDPALAQLIQATDDLDISSEEEEDENTSSTEDEAFKCFKDEYYRNKLEFEKVTPEVLRSQAEGYVRAIQWNLNYYYNGVCSWSWFYPHHYSPYISDIKDFADVKIEFELGKPFKPYEQLLAVLPTDSKNLLPKSYHRLMTDDSSAIKQYYPEKFETDLNGKQQEWEAVVLVPFIDEILLLEAMKPCNEKLSLDELKRNNHGPMLIYKYVDDDLGVYEAPNYFLKVTNNHANCVKVEINEIRVLKENLVKGAYPGVVFDVFYPGFPTLKHLEFEHKLKKAKVKVFEMPSRYDNMILKIKPNELYFEDSIPIELLASTVWVSWPHLVEAKVEAISNRKVKYIYSADNEKGYTITERTGKSGPSFESELETNQQYFRDRMGIDFGETNVLVHVRLMTGRKYTITSNVRVNLEKQFSSTLSNFPLQGVVSNIESHDEFYTVFKEITDIFPTGCICFSLTNPSYGSAGTVLDSTETLKNNQMKVSFRSYQEPDLSAVFKVQERLNHSYLNLSQAASQVQLSNYVFSRITGTLFIAARTQEGIPKSVNIGLDLKFTQKNQEIPGYTRKINNSWFYSQKAVLLVAEYLEKFPEILYHLSQDQSNDIVADHIFDPTESDEKVKLIQNWLKTIPTHRAERRVCGDTALDKEVIVELEKVIDEYKDDESANVMVLNVKPEFLYRPELQMGNLPPDPTVVTKVFDRIVNIREGYSVPFGLKGTVIAFQKSSAADNDDEMYDVVFDSTFTGGMALNCSDFRGYRLPKYSFINLSHGKRLMEERTGVPGALRAFAKDRRNNASNFHMNNSGNNTKNNLSTGSSNSAFASFNTMKQLSASGSNAYTKNPQFQENQPQFSRNQSASAQPYFSKNHQSGSTPPQFSRNHLPVSTSPHNSKNQSMSNDRKGNNSFYFLSDFTGGVPAKPKTDEQIRNKKNNNQVIIQNKEKVTQQSVKAIQKRPMEGEQKPAIATSSSTRGKRQEISAKRTEVNTDFLKKILKISNNNPISSTANAPNKSVYDSSPKSSVADNGPILANPSARLLSYYQANSLGCPRYTYMNHPHGIFAQITLPDGTILTGNLALTREAASNEAAATALNRLLNSHTFVNPPVPHSVPSPPRNWVQAKPQDAHVDSKVFINTSYQSRNHGFNQPDVVNTKPRNDFHPSFQQQNAPNATVSSNFVPLQALKKRPFTKAEPPRNRLPSSANSTNNGAALPSETVAKAQLSADQSLKPPTKNKGKPRKSRIAANFIKKN